MRAASRVRLLPAGVMAIAVLGLGCAHQAASRGPAEHHHRHGPRADVERYIALLDHADRAAWQKPDAVVRALGLRGDETVIDLGAGSGYFAFRFARALPRGQVIAADTEPAMIRHLQRQAARDGVRNVRASLIANPNEPPASAEADLVFVCNVLHHVERRQSWLARLVKEMKPGARLALIEFKEGKLPQGPPESVKIPRARLVALMTEAGLVLEDERPALLPYQTYLVFRKPGGPPRPAR